MDDKRENPDTPRYRWPWFVLAAILLAIVLAIVWMGFAVHRLHEYREPYAIPPATNR